MQVLHVGSATEMCMGGPPPPTSGRRKVPFGGSPRGPLASLGATIPEVCGEPYRRSAKYSETLGLQPKAVKPLPLDVLFGKENAAAQKTPTKPAPGKQTPGKRTPLRPAPRASPPRASPPRASPPRASPRFQGFAPLVAPGAWGSAPPLPPGSPPPPNR